MQLLSAHLSNMAPPTPGTFTTWDDVHHRVAILDLAPGWDGEMLQRRADSAGGAWFTFSYENVAVLRKAHDYLAEHMGLSPLEALESEPYISLFYADPDNNVFELNTQRIAPEEMDAYFSTAAFTAWPPGAPFDADEAAAWERLGAPGARL